MAGLEDLEFWLPSEFLTDDDVLTDFKRDRLKTRRNDDYSYGFGNSFGICSDLSSPTTETESDDDYEDRISELSRKLSLSAVQDSNFSADYAAKGWKLSGSPQSTLCGCKAGSRSSPNSHSGVCSPPDGEDQRRWNMLYAAAGEVARMRMIEETAAFCSSKLYVPHAKPSPFIVPQQSRNPHQFYPNHQAQTQSHRSYQLLQAAKFQQMKQHQMMKGVHSQGLTEFPVQNGRRNGGEAPVQPSFQQPGSGMRAVFLGETGVKKERTGTGVFLPQRFGSVPPETRKKPGCSTVLLPEKVVHALNFNRDAIDAQNRSNGSFYNDYEAGLNSRDQYMMAQQRRRQAVMNQQLRLPQEWTY